MFWLWLVSTLVVPPAVGFMIDRMKGFDADPDEWRRPRTWEYRRRVDRRDSPRRHEQFWL